MRKTEVILGLVLVVLVSSLANLLLETLASTQPPDMVPPEGAGVEVVGDSEGNITWFVHITDLHLSKFSAPDRTESLVRLTKQFVSHVSPSAVVVTGDLTDAKTQDYSGSRQFREEWEMYREVVDLADNSSLVWLDIRGNHDNFDVSSVRHDENMFRTHSSQGRRGNFGSYLHVMEHNGVRLGFLGVDATLKPGPRRPFNFVGALSLSDMEELARLSERAKRETDGTVWFGHYPTSVIVSPPGLHSLMSSGLLYLCGHLHNLHGLSWRMVARHKEGLREAELADWKDNRMFRLLALDHGLLTWTDVSTKSDQAWPLVLVTWPPRADTRAGDREPLYRMLVSTHIRLLVFSRVGVTKVSVRLDGGPEVVCSTKGGGLYTAAWDPRSYSRGLHNMSVMVETEVGTKEVTDHVFSLAGDAPDLPLVGRLVLLLDMISTFQLVFILLVTVSVLPITLVRLSYPLSILSPLLQPVATIPSIYYPLTLGPLYLCIGPWFLGEVLSDQLGLVFVWGTLLLSPFPSYLPTATTYLYGTYHLLTTHLPLVLTLSLLLHTRMAPTPFLPTLVLAHGLMVPQVLHQTYLVYSLYLAYGWPVLLGPFRSGHLLLTLITWARATNIPRHEIRGSKL